eukprot:16128190-Heterocapsa_arctica.AAC.1
MAPRLAQQRGPPSADGCVRIITDEKSSDILTEKCFAMTVKVIHYVREAAYQTMHGLVRLVRPRKDDTVSVPCPGTLTMEDDEMPSKRRRLCDADMIDIGNATERPLKGDMR